MTRNTHRPEMHRNAPVKEHVRVATTGAITLATGLENGDTIDGKVLATGDRVLVKDQGSAENGIYIVPASGAPARSYDMDTGIEAMGALIYVREGTANGGKLFKNTNATLPTIGVTTLTFDVVSGAASLALDDLTDVNAPAPGDGDLLSWDDGAGEWVPAAPGAGLTKADLPGALEVVIDGGGSAITTGIKGDVEMPFAGTFTAWRLFADTSGDIVIDIWKDTYTAFPPTDGDAMPGSGKEPTIPATNAKAEDTSITDWTTDDFAAGDILRFNVDSVHTVTRVTLSLTYVRT